MLIKDLPKEIRDLVSKRRKEYGDNRNIEDCGFESVAKCNKYTRLGFAWDETIEGQGFWQKIQNGNFNEFYEKYPKVTSSYKALPFPNSNADKFLKLKVIKPLKGASGTPFEEEGYPKVGDITWAYLRQIGSKYGGGLYVFGNTILIENSRFCINFDGDCFEIIKEEKEEEEVKKPDYLAKSRYSDSILLKVIKPLKSLSNSNADSTPWPKVGDITWTSNRNLQFIGIPGTVILLEDNRYFQNFCGGSFEVVSEISSGATDKHIVPIVTDTHSMSSGLRADTSIIGVVGISDVVTEENLTRVLDRYKKNELETLIECETEFKKKNKNRKLI